VSDAAAPFVRETALLSGSFREQGAQLFGIDIRSARMRSRRVSGYLLRGTLEDLDTPFTVILGVSLARASASCPATAARDAARGDHHAPG
jgi:ABC-type lipoprotein release transport system permease subunit